MDITPAYLEEWQARLSNPESPGVIKCFMTVGLINGLVETYLKSRAIGPLLESHFEMARELQKLDNASPEDVAELEAAIERIRARDRARRKLLDFQPVWTDAPIEQATARIYRHPGHINLWEASDEPRVEVKVFRAEEMADYLRLLDETDSSPVSDSVCEEVD